jgi:hypothetical protein
MKHCRSHGQTETGYARHRRPTTFEDKMIGQKVNSPAQKLLRSARRKRGALQGVKCLLAVIQASWVSHGASPQIKMQEQVAANILPSGEFGQACGVPRLY